LLLIIFKISEYIWASYWIPRLKFC